VIFERIGKFSDLFKEKEEEKPVFM